MARRVLVSVVCCLAVVLTTAACRMDDEFADWPGPSPGVTDDEIRIGSSLALSGHAKYLGIQTLRGAQAYINHVNAEGGVNGRRIRLLAMDDRYEPVLCLHNTQKLIVEEEVFSLFSYVGTPTTLRIVPLVDKASVPLVGMFTGAGALREPFLRELVNVRASYYQEIEAAVRHLVKDMGLEKIAVFYQYDAYGFDGLRGTEVALRKYDMAPVASGSYVRGSLKVEEGLERILGSDAEAVVLVGTYEPCARFIRLARDRRPGLLFYNVSFVGGEELARLLGASGENVLVSQVVPPPVAPQGKIDAAITTGDGELGADTDGVADYILLLGRYFPSEKPSFVGLEGYFNARVLVEGLRRAGRNLTRDRFLDAIESIGDWSIGAGNEIHFGPADHQGLDRVYFTRIRNGGLELVDDWQAYARDMAVGNGARP